MRFLIAFFLMIFWNVKVVLAQLGDYRVVLEPVPMNNFTGIQSAAVGQWNGKLILVGGRTDGLHRRQPFASFLPDGANPQIIVADPENGASWSVGLGGLPGVLQEQFKATNLQFCQEGPWLYLTGGYGYSSLADDHVTHPLLTVVRMDSLILQIQTGSPIASSFRWITNDQFAVTGGRMVRQGGIFYIAGGQRFEGRYNPMNHPTFVQTYTNAIRRFRLNDDGVNVTVEYLPEWMDDVQLHRRDYNLAAQVFPDGRVGFTMFSGVFQQFVDLPYLNTVDFDSSGFQVNNTFEHRLNQYHCALASLYSAGQNRMQTLFFGGIAQFYFDTANQLKQDDNVPFVSTIGRVTRNGLGEMKEEKTGDMPGLLGAGAEFFPLQSLARIPGTDILDADALAGDSICIGYIVGGIESDLPNVFFGNQEDDSRAHPGIYKVFLVPGIGTSPVRLPGSEQSVSAVKLIPNPTHVNAVLEYTLNASVPVGIILQTSAGKTIIAKDLGTMTAGRHQFEFRLENFPQGIYPVILNAGQHLVTLKLLVK